MKIGGIRWGEVGHMGDRELSPLTVLGYDPGGRGAHGGAGERDINTWGRSRETW